MNTRISAFARRLRESAAIARFGDGFMARTSLFFALVLRSILHNTGVVDAKLPTVRASLRRNGVRFSLMFRTHEELMLFYEIFCDRIYQVSGIALPEVIIDLGANVGISTLFLHTEYPNAQIIAVEAHPEIFERLVASVRGVEKIKAIHAAVGSRDGAVELHVGASTVGASLLVRKENDRTISVPGARLDSILKNAGLNRADFIKFDIEGAEWDVFTSFSMRDAVLGLAGEIHEDLMHHSLGEFESLWSGMHMTAEPGRKIGRYIFHGKRA